MDFSMLEPKRLMNLSESYGTYVMLGAVALIAGLLVGNLGTFSKGTFNDVMAGLSGILRQPGLALFMGGFVAAGVAGDTIPGKVRVACLCIGTLLFLRFFGAVPYISA